MCSLIRSQTSHLTLLLEMANTLRQLKRATEIVQRYRERGNVFPRELRDCGRGDPTSQQEYRDACKVKTWKYSLLGKNIYNCSDEIRDYLDENMPGWSDRVYSHQGQSSTVQMQKARQIVERYRERGHALPRRLKDPTKAQETKDAINISTWKSSLKGYNRVTCSKELCSYLDENMPGWRQDHHKSKPRSAHGKEKARRALLEGTTAGELDRKERSSELLMPLAVGIVERFNANNKQYPSLKLSCRQDPARQKEYSDAKKLHSWKSHTDKSLAPDVFQYLDVHMPNWKNPCHVAPTVKNAPVSRAREIFRRCSMRGGTMPRLATCHQTDPEKILEHNDGLKLREWKISMIENPASFCPVLREYLDEKVPLWRHIDIISPLLYDMKAESAKAAALAKQRNQAATAAKATASTKRKVMSAEGSDCGSQHSTDGELSSFDGSEFGSDDDETGAAFAHGVRKRARGMSLQCINRDESAGIEALLQLSGSPVSSPVPLSADAPFSDPFAPALPLFSTHSPFIPAPASRSTYGNGSSSPHPPMNSLYVIPKAPMTVSPVPGHALPITVPVAGQSCASNGLELYLSGKVGCSS